MLMRVVDQMSGYEAHLAAGEKDLSVRFGQEGAARITISLLIVVYALNVVLVIFFDLSFVLLFLTIPLALRMGKGFKDRDDKYRWIRHVPNMLKIATGQELLIALSIALSMLLGGTIRSF
jgi:1,4-dihydroxy-2-naphthoate octaprenyltransferase